MDMSEQTQQTGQQEVNAPLSQLAQACGVATEYKGQQGEIHVIADRVVAKVLTALGIDVEADDAEGIAAHLQRLTQERQEALCSPTVLQELGVPTALTLNCQPGALAASLTLEDGSDGSGELLLRAGEEGQTLLELGSGIPMGYHRLDLQAGERQQRATLITAPQRIPLPEAVKEHARWGWMTQLYSVRSHGSWGVGDFADLAQLLAAAGSKSGADFMLINPIHAGEPQAPLQPSPYFPASRTFLNPLYIRPQSIAAYKELGESERMQADQLFAQAAEQNSDPNRLDRDLAWTCKKQALWLIFQQARPSLRVDSAFAQFVRAGGQELESFALWCLAYQHWGQPQERADSWFRSESPHSARVQALKASDQEGFEFYLWLQWVANQQLEEAQRSGKAAGMVLGLMEDMAVGVNPLGEDVWSHPERYARGASVGAPPDAFNQQGQNWLQPPLDPLDLERTGYKAYRQLVGGMFAHSGAIRIDHALGLFRLWWIPAGSPASEGTYVTYNYKAMLSVLAIEATRAGGIVVGEDLGVVPDFAAQALADRGVLGTIIEWFEQKDGVFKNPAGYRKYALAAVTTHDLPPTAGYLQYEHVHIRERLGLLAQSAQEFEAAAQDEHRAMLQFLVAGGWLDPAVAGDERGHTQEIVEAMHRAVLSAPSLLKMAALVDGVGESRSQNQPGTIDEYPNWRVPLADEKGRVVYAEEVFDLPRVQALAQVMREGI
ncbi:4-alpha-glucanotransferase [Bombiscardovia nodaiensis]|uniref:4-alpha-glucanotransferase n=1 Tax=Bombiscardovia nodaiensis TaxID=2932181 RepID=A0ABN6S7U6_9BIFI|nr:4-alpha-glucanotransferase [Bombiscardovia nodaiensis]